MNAMLAVMLSHQIENNRLTSVLSHFTLIEPSAFGHNDLDGHFFAALLRLHLQNTPKRSLSQHFLGNIRLPQLQGEVMRSRCHSCLRIRERMKECAVLCLLPELPSEHVCADRAHRKADKGPNADSNRSRNGEI
jgi:hypothetical protein